MFTATNFYRTCIALVGAVSVRGDCFMTPDKDGIVVITGGTETITPGAFKRCDALEKIIIPASVKNIGKQAFLEATNLKKVFFKKGSNLKDIGDQAFSGCNSLERFDFPNSLKKIGKSVFFRSGLQKVSFKNGIQVIGNGAFNSCSSLKKITFPRSLRRIGKDAFSYSGLEEIKFYIKRDSRLQEIGVHAFFKSENLKTINIPTGVEIRPQAFKETGCSSDMFVPGATIVDCSLE